MRHVEQPDDPPGGCGIAALAMLLDLTYVQMQNAAPDLCAKCGVEYDVLFDILAQFGYGVQAVQRMRASDGSLRTPWPPRPWMKRHLVCVMQTAEDSVAHYVVMDARGIVLDPADARRRECKLSRYYAVEWIAALVPARAVVQ